MRDSLFRNMRRAMAREDGMAKHHVPAANRPPPTNNLLAALPRRDFERIAVSLDLLPLTLKQTIHKVGEPVQHVLFPRSGFVSMLAVLDNGSMIEVATIGREGMTGLPGALNGDPSPGETFVQGEGDPSYRMPVKAFRQEMDRHETFSALVTRFNHALFAFIMQSTACNAVHSVEQRLSRWLLLAQDRMESDNFPLTHEFLAMMLGVTRPSVTVVAGTLQKAGMITYRRGHMTILDREQLESASCECYRAITELLTRVTHKAR